MRHCSFVIISWTVVCYAASSLPNPRIVEHPQDGYVAKDDPASLNCRAEGDPKPVITWYRNGEKVETSPENPYSNRMIFPDGKLFFLSVVHNKKDKTDVGVYYCNATNIHGSAISRNATLSIAVLRNDFRQQPKNISAAIGDSVSFPCRPPRGEPEPRIIWKKNAELIISVPSNRFIVTDTGSLNISQVRKQDAGIYTCIATNKAGEKESVPAILKVIEKPSFRRFPVDITTREGKTVEFPCDVVGDKPLQVTWKKEKGKIGRISTLRDHTLRIEDVSREDTGVYVCVAKNQGGEAEAVAHLNVEYSPEFKVRPVDKTVVAGHSVSLPCAVEGNPNPTIYWRRGSQQANAEKSLIFPYKPDGRYSVKPDGTLQIDNVQPSDAGEFECEALNTVGTASTSVQLKVKESNRPPPIIRIGPQNQTLATDETAYLHCEAFGNPTPKIRWYKNGNILSSDDPRIQQTPSGTLEISGLRVSDTGMYACKAVSETGETTWTSSLVVKVPGGSSVLFHRAQDPSYFPGPPSKPIDIETKTTSVMLSWQPNSNSGASPVFAYIVEYFSHETTDGWVAVSDTVQKLKYTVQNLQPDTSYIFQVRAQNSHGIGMPSQVSDVITTKGLGSKVGFSDTGLTDLGAGLSGIVVEIVRGEAVNSSSIWFAWKPVKEQEIIQHYEIEYRRVYNLEDMTTGQVRKILVGRHAEGSRPETFTITNLKSHAWYQICVKAFNGEIGSQCSSPLKVRTRESVPPSDPPQNIIISKDGKTRVYLQWLPPPTESRNGDIKGYEIKCLSDDGKHDCSVSINGTGNKFTINNLQEDMTYSIQMAARTGQGIGVWSKPYIVGPEQPSLMEEPWFIGVLIGVVGGTLWLALCIFSIWLCKKRKNKKKMMQNGLYTVPMHKGDDRPCTTFYRNGYGEKDAQNMSPEITNLLDGHKEVEMQDHNIYNVPQMKTFYHKQDPVAPYATTTLINPGAAQHMFRPIHQNSGSGDSCCKHDCSGSNTDNSHSGGHHHSDHMQSPTSDSGSHTTDENGMLIKKGRKGQGQIIVPKQAMVNWAEFLPPPPEHPPPSEVGSDSPANSLQYAEVNQNRGMANRSPMSPMSKISSCSCPVPHSQQPVCAQVWNVPPPAYSDSGCVRCCSPKYCDNGQYSAINRVQSPRSDTWGQRTIACTNPSQRAPIDIYCHNRSCHSDHEQNSIPPLQYYKINNNEQEGEYQCLSDSGHYSRCPVDGHCMDRACQSSLPSVASECHTRGPCRLSDGGHHHMGLAVEGYHRNGDSPMSGQDFVGESDSESSPPQEGEDCGDENHEDEGSNVSGSMMASWASVTDQSNTDCSSHRSSAASDSDASFLTEADFASAVAKAAELSGLTVVGTTVCDPKTGKPVKRHRRPRPARPVSPYSTDSNYSAVAHRPYPKSQRKKQLIEQGKWQKKDQPNSVATQSLPSNGTVGLMKV